MFVKNGFIKYLRLTVLFTALLAVFAQNFINLGIGISYQLNKKYIAERLCENRNRPAMHCNGKCYLHKQLQQQNEAQNKIPARSFFNEDSFVSDIPASFSFVIIPQMERVFAPATAVSALSLAYTAGVFRPPLTA